MQIWTENSLVKGRETRSDCASIIENEIINAIVNIRAFSIKKPSKNGLYQLALSFTAENLRCVIHPISEKSIHSFANE